MKKMEVEKLPIISETLLEKLPEKKLIEYASSKGYDFSGYDDEILEYLSKEDLITIIQEQRDGQLADSEAVPKKQKNAEELEETQKTKTLSRNALNKQKKREQTQKVFSGIVDDEEKKEGMKFVEPIRDLKKIQEMKDYFRERNYRNYMLFLIGVNTAYRITDLVQLRVKDFDNDFKKVAIIELKTGKSKSAYFHPKIQAEIKKYIKEKKLTANDFLFPSRKRKDMINSKGEIVLDENNKPKKVKVPITRQQASTILEEAYYAVGLKPGGSYGCHSLRKTWAYWKYQETKDVAMLMRKLNHSAQIVTLQYIGITDDIEKEEADGFYV